jgi:hypothetical protein
MILVQNRKSAPSGTPLSVTLKWCSIKDDYGTLAELEDVNVVNLYIGAGENYLHPL